MIVTLFTISGNVRVYEDIHRISISRTHIYFQTKENKYFSFPLGDLDHIETKEK